MRNLKKIWGVARTEYVNWITDPRIIVLGVLMIFIKTLVIDPLAMRADKFGDTMIIFEPYIAVGNSSVLLLFMPLVFLILLADYPRLGGNSMFFISRTGKKNWLCGQILFLIMAITTFIASIFIASMLFSGGHFGTEWSEAVRKYAARFPDEAFSFDSQLLPPNLYNQTPMITAVWQTSVLLGAYLLALSLIIYLVKILYGGPAGLAAAAAVMALGTVTSSLSTDIRWALPTSNTILWYHYTNIFSEPIYPLWASFLYFGVLLAVLITGCFIALKKLKFTENK